MVACLRKRLETKEALLSGQADTVSELGDSRLLLLLLLCPNVDSPMRTARVFLG